MGWEKEAGLVLAGVLQWLKSIKSIPNRVAVSGAFALGLLLYYAHIPPATMTLVGVLDWLMAASWWAAAILGLSSAVGHFIPALATDSKVTNKEVS